MLRKPLWAIKTDYYLSVCVQKITAYTKKNPFYGFCNFPLTNSTAMNMPNEKHCFLLTYAPHILISYRIRHVFFLCGVFLCGIITICTSWHGKLISGIQFVRVHSNFIIKCECMQRTPDSKKMCIYASVVPTYLFFWDEHTVFFL